METPHFHGKQNSTEDKNYRPSTKLPEHLEVFLTTAKGLRGKLTEVLREVTELTDKMALRSAALPESN